MKLTNLDAWEPAPGDLFVLKAHGAPKRKFRLIIAVGESSTYVLAWSQGNFRTSEAYSREWFNNYREYIVEVHRP